MKERFMLNKDCFLVKGTKRGAIYNLQSGDIYSIDEESCNLIALCESTLDLKDILIDPLFVDRNKEAFSFLENLAQMNLGRFLDGDEAIRKIKILPPKNKLDFIWLEITKKCNLRCLHCYNESSPNQQVKDKMFYDDWLIIMKDAYRIGCRNIQFIGGEPFVTRDLLMRLVIKAKETGYEFVEIFTNGTLIDKKDICLFKDYRIALAISIYGPNNEIHDLITKKSGSFEKTIRRIKIIKEKGVQLRLATVVMRQNQDFLEETLDFIREDLGIEQARYDIVRPSGRGCSHDLIPKKLRYRHKMINPIFPKCSLETFQRMRYGHNCFSKDICVSCNGDVIPCIMERDIKFGNIFEESFATIIENEKSKSIRMMSKDFIEVCKDCEYRYACFDCRPKAKGFQNNLYAKPAECMYNPYLGKWEGGDEHGNCESNTR